MDRKSHSEPVKDCAFELSYLSYPSVRPYDTKPET